MPCIRTVYNQSLGNPTWYDEWYDEAGLRHRDDGPAVVGEDGTEAWWQHGKLHRLDGPAVTAGKYQAWWENGIQLRVQFESGRVYVR